VRCRKFLLSSPRSHGGLDLEIRSRQCLALHAVRTELLSVPENATAFSEGFNRFADTRRCGPISKRIKNTRTGSMLRPARIRILARARPPLASRSAPAAYRRISRKTSRRLSQHEDWWNDPAETVFRFTAATLCADERNRPRFAEYGGNGILHVRSVDERHHEKWRMPTPRGAR
jgi:hypothetical protein